MLSHKDALAACSRATRRRLPPYEQLLLSLNKGFDTDSIATMPER
ncbi:hypothetical protein [Thiohalocapsa sp. ML1]|jgi:hypothetical protein|nr:hypothetical protein [Thiohalocapsa sp. ML1]